MILEVIRDGGGRWDTRSIDLELGRRGAQIESGILSDLRRLADQYLIREDGAAPQRTGPRWHLTARGAKWLEGKANTAEE